jgi:serine/threonine protein kinase
MDVYIRTHNGNNTYIIPKRLRSRVRNDACKIVCAWYVLITTTHHRHFSLQTVRRTLCPDCPWKQIGNTLGLLFDTQDDITQRDINQLSSIGHGNMSVLLTTYKGTLVAVKQQLFHRGSWEVSSHVVHEFIAMKKTGHYAWCPTILFRTLTEDMFQIGMEYIPISMRQMVHFGNRNIDFIRTIMIQLLRALSDLHSIGLAHRDVKPDNIRFRADGALVLIDYDSCEAFEGPGVHRTKLVCTPLYRDPYLFQPDADITTYDYTKLDAFSCGAVFLYMLLHNKHPFQGNGDVCIYSSMLTFLQNDLHGLSSTIRTKLKSTDILVIHGLLDIDPSTRMSVTDAYTLYTHMPLK